MSCNSKVFHLFGCGRNEIQAETGVVWRAGGQKKRIICHNGLGYKRFARLIGVCARKQKRELPGALLAEAGARANGGDESLNILDGGR